LTASSPGPPPPITSAAAVEPPIRRPDMLMPCRLALLAVQQPAPQPLLPQPIARVDVRPAAYALKVGDTLRLSATAYDSAGKAVDGVVFAWFTSGGFFEGKVD